MIRSTQTTMYRLDNLNNEQQRISYQMSTGKKLQYGSDDANVYTREVYIDDKINVYEGLKVQIEKANAQNTMSDSTLAEAKDLVSYIKAEVTKALNATTDDTARLAIATNLEGVKENLLMLANEQVEGEYLFAGSDTSVKPFVMDASGSVKYMGDDELRKIAVDEGSYRDRGVTGLETFFHSVGKVTTGEILTFTDNDKIKDENGFTWLMNNFDQFVQFDLEGNFTGTWYPGTRDGSTPPIYSVNITAAGKEFEKESTIFTTLDNIINALKKEDKNGNTITDIAARTELQNGLDDISTAYDSMNLGHAKLGGRNKVFEISYERVSAKLTQYNILSQEVGAADLSKVAVEAKALELTYTALYSTINKMNELSLVNFVR